MDPNVNVRHLHAVRICLIILLSSHWVGCIFYLIARVQDFSPDTWINDFEHLLPLYRIEESTLAINYLLCIYKGFNALSNLAYDLGVPLNLAEVFFSLTVMLGQVYISALILGECLKAHTQLITCMVFENMRFDR